MEVRFQRAGEGGFQPPTHGRDNKMRDRVFYCHAIPVRGRAFYWRHSGARPRILMDRDLALGCWEERARN